MTTLLDLYNLRRNIAQNRQSIHTTSYTQLHEFLMSLNITHPYDLDFGTKLKFERLKFYVNDAFGSHAIIPARDDFIYRICSIIDVVKGTEWRNDKSTDIANWNQIYKKSKGNWMRLSNFAAGTYTCHPRRFSWWTSFPLFQDVISGAHLIGMTNDWVANQCVILRCPVDYVNNNNLAFVPSVIDAFMQMIFHPTKNANSAPYGITIDLSLYPETLSPGIDEMVLPEISVDQIEILPVNADDHYRKGKLKVFSDSPIFCELLEHYYRNL